MTQDTCHVDTTHSLTDSGHLPRRHYTQPDSLSAFYRVDTTHSMTDSGHSAM